MPLGDTGVLMSIHFPASTKIIPDEGCPRDWAKILATL